MASGQTAAAATGAQPPGGCASTAVVISLDYPRDGVAYISGPAMGAHAYQTIYLDRRLARNRDPLRKKTRPCGPLMSWIVQAFCVYLEYYSNHIWFAVWLFFLCFASLRKKVFRDSSSVLRPSGVLFQSYLVCSMAVFNVSLLYAKRYFENDCWFVVGFGIRCCFGVRILFVVVLY